MPGHTLLHSRLGRAAAKLLGQPAVKALPSYPAKSESEQGGTCEKDLPTYDQKKLGARSYGCLMALLPDAIRKEITDWTLENIPDWHLGAGGRKGQIHCTIKYGMENDEPALLGQLCQDHGPITLRLLGSILFPEGKDGVPLVIEVDSPDLHQLNALAGAAVPCYDKYPDYKPHVTLAYLDASAAHLYQELALPWTGRELTLTEVQYSSVDDERTNFSLGVLPFLGNKAMEGGTCEPGQTASQTGCTPASRGSGKEEESSKPNAKPKTEVSFSSKCSDDTKRVFSGVLADLPESLKPKSVRFMLGNDKKPSYALGDAVVISPRDAGNLEVIRHELMHVWINEHPELLESFSKLKVAPTLHTYTSWTNDPRYNADGENFAMAMDALFSGDFDEFTPGDTKAIKKWLEDNVPYHETTSDKLRKDLPLHPHKALSIDDPIKVHLPDLEQQKSWSCGACAARILCEFFGIGPEEEKEYRKLLGTSAKEGTHVARMISFLKEQGLKVTAKEGMTVEELKEALDAGKPILVLLQAWGYPEDYPEDGSGHYALIIGYDNECIYFEDPWLKGRRAKLRTAEFEERWHDTGSDEKDTGHRFVHWGMVCWKPTKVEYLKGLEDYFTKSESKKGTCEQGERADLTGCTPAGGESSGKQSEGATAPSKEPTPPKLESSKVGTGSLPLGAKGKTWVKEWTYGREGVPAGQAKDILTPDKEIIRQMTPYRPDKPIMLYRSHRVGKDSLPVESWTTTKAMAESMADPESWEEGEERVVITRLVDPSEIVVDMSRLPEELEGSVLSNEVVVANGSFAGNMAKTRGEKLQKASQWSGKWGSIAPYAQRVDASGKLTPYKKGLEDYPTKAASATTSQSSKQTATQTTGQTKVEAPKQTEPKFSGRQEDALGRQRCYSEGVLVACNQLPDQPEAAEEQTTDEEIAEDKFSDPSEWQKSDQARTALPTEEKQKLIEQWKQEGGENEDFAKWFHKQRLKNESKVQFDAEWSKALEGQAPEIQAANVLEHDFSTEEVAAEQNWHAEFIQWRWGLMTGGQEMGEDGKPFDNLGGSFRIRPADASKVARFVSGLLNPLMGGAEYVGGLLQKLMGQGKLPKTDPAIGQQLEEYFNGLSPDNEANKPAAELVANLVGDQALGVVKAMSGGGTTESKPAEEPKVEDSQIAKEEATKESPYTETSGPTPEQRAAAGQVTGKPSKDANVRGRVEKAKLKAQAKQRRLDKMSAEERQALAEAGAEKRAAKNVRQQQKSEKYWDKQHKKQIGDLEKELQEAEKSDDATKVQQVKNKLERELREINYFRKERGFSEFDSDGSKSLDGYATKAMNLDDKKEAYKLTSRLAQLATDNPPFWGHTPEGQDYHRAIREVWMDAHTVTERISALQRFIGKLGAWRSLRMDSNSKRGLDKAEQLARQALELYSHNQTKDLSWLGATNGGSLVGYHPRLRASRLQRSSLGSFSKGLSYSTKDQQGRSYFASCERDDEGHCLPSGEESADKPTDKPKSKPKNSSEEPGTTTTPIKQRAVKGDLVGARREGTGKEAKVVLADGSPAPEHIKPSMVPPAWKNVRISMDPEADIQVSALMYNDKKKKNETKTVYNAKYLANNQAAKFAKIQEGLAKQQEVYNENQQNRTNPELVELADCVWLMQEQATRPGGEADTKGYAALYGQPLTADNITIKRDKKGKVSMALKLDGKVIPIKDDGTKQEIMRRLDNNLSLEDSTYWLKSHGATTLEDRHVVEAEDGIRLQFVGKEGVWHDHLIKNPQLASTLKQRKQSAGERQGKLFNTDYGQVARYSRKLDGGNFTPKDFRTMKATRMAIEEINANHDCCKTAEDYRASVQKVAEKVSGVLGNRWQQALESYISPAVWSVWRGATNG